MELIINYKFMATKKTKEKVEVKIEEITTDYSHTGMQELVNKINEIIRFINK